MSIALLGSTGSIGTQTADVARSLGLNISVISAKSNVKIIENQIRSFAPKIAVMTDIDAAKDLRIRVKDTNTKVLCGEDSICESIDDNDIDTVVNAIVGFAGLNPSVAAINKHKRLALANKESLVAGGEFITSLARENNVEIFPIDSEHSAIFQCLLSSSNKKDELEKIIITCSGGPFRGKDIGYLSSVTPEQAVKHPKWNMGRKISVDSATLMNKGLEVIEAVRLFNVTVDMIDVVIHKESIIHSMVMFKDKTVIAQMSYPDMRLPISYALTYPERKYDLLSPLDFYSIGSFSFEKPDIDTFECLKCAYTALKKGGNCSAALNGANEEAVNAFLNNKISFIDIPKCINYALDNYCDTEVSLAGVIAADNQGRKNANEVIKSLRR